MTAYDARTVEAEQVALLRRTVDADIKADGEWASTMVRAGLLRDILDHYQALPVSPGPTTEPSPIPMILHCPVCHLQHIDEPDERTPDWTNPPHRSHLCHGCGCIWRPADVATGGVARIPTRGKSDTWPADRAGQTVTSNHSPVPTPEHVPVCQCGKASPHGYPCIECRRARLAEAITKQDEVRGRPLTDGEKLENLQLWIGDEGGSDALGETVEKLRELLAKATDDDLADEGRYFHESCCNFTSCGHGDTGEYGNPSDGKLVEFLWNNRRTLLTALEQRGDGRAISDPTRRMERILDAKFTPRSTPLPMKED